MTALQSLAHDLNVANTFETVIGTAVGEFDQVGNEIPFNLGRIHEVRHAEFSAKGLAVRVEVNPDNLVGPDQSGALNHVQSDPAESEDHNVRAGFDFCRVDYGADPRGDATADVAHLVEGRVFANLGERDFRHNGVV